ncbi:hypothetical protein EVAR_100330_1 [Eumeta japonica]|uniref:Uncharacterized protein n=1 Tax=Eumeta variegata TaxID=151549 RepID=A0A4C2ACT0_EUMVA|nr:hypothetical protein EVAR_100330_1 [Eumeta japonica]
MAGEALRSKLSWWQWVRHGYFEPTVRPGFTGASTVGRVALDHAGNVVAVTDRWVAGAENAQEVRRRWLTRLKTDSFISVNSSALRFEANLNRWPAATNGVKSITKI